MPIRIFFIQHHQSNSHPSKGHFWAGSVNKKRLAYKMKSPEVPTCCTFCAFMAQKSRPAATVPFEVPLLEVITVQKYCWTALLTLCFHMFVVAVVVCLKRSLVTDDLL